MMAVVGRVTEHPTVYIIALTPIVRARIFPPHFSGSVPRAIALSASSAANGREQHCGATLLSV